jgi:hypothetical protein
MTKAKARARAKARALAKAANPKKKGEKSDAAPPAVHHGPRSNSTGKMTAGANIKSASGMRRGAARSR